MQELWIIGTSLSESAQPLDAELLTRASVIIGESAKVTRRRLKNCDPQRPVFFLDNLGTREMRQLQDELSRATLVVLFSDCGMPILFDPGREVLELCRKLGYIIRSSPGPTSWGSAAALSGFAPPFLLWGFLPKDKAAREKAWKHLASQPAHTVLLETPYRFQQLVAEAGRHWEGRKQAFIAWKIGSAEERLVWTSIRDLQTTAEKLKLEKGEFVLVLEGRLDALSAFRSDQ